MKDPRRANFISFFGYLFPVSDNAVLRCWRAARKSLHDEDLDGLLAALRETVIAKAAKQKSENPVPLQDRVCND